MLTASLVGSLVWSIGSQNGQIYTALLGRDASRDLIASSQETVSSVTNKLQNSSYVGRATNSVLWMLVGGLLYAIIIMPINLAGALKKLKARLHYVNADRQRLIRENKIRLMARLLIIIGWAIFTVVFFRVIAPFGLACLHFAGNNLLTLAGLGYLLLGSAVFFVSFHLHTIFLRLCSLKSRLF
ncbi:MAG TPA: hypothetical protein VLG37_05365 [Candidatus Saccharimonadales bacterium]|nr:hypothetical protein [Candidatus Saccharimonadales bacterium]